MPARRPVTRTAWRAWAAAALGGSALLAAVVQSVAPSAGASTPRVALVQPSPGPASAAEAAARAPSAAASVSGPVLVLGDSVAAGTACDCTPYGTLLARGLADRTGRPVRVINEGADGLTTSGLLAQLALPSVRRALAAAEVVTVTIGANDLDEGSAQDADCAGATCYDPAVEQLSAHVQQALRQIGELVPARARVLVTGYWNVFLDGAVGRAQGATYVANSDALTRRVNAVIQADALAAHDTYVDVYGPFESRSLPGLTALLAPDGDHPSAAGHAIIAGLLLASL